MGECMLCHEYEVRNLNTDLNVQLTVELDYLTKSSKITTTNKEVRNQMDVIEIKLKNGA